MTARLLGLLTIIGLLGCFVVSASAKPPDPPPNPQATRSRLNGRLAVGIDPSYPPFAAIAPGDRLLGFDVDFATELASRLGAKAEFVGMDVGTIFEALIQKKFDVVISAVPPYPEYGRELIYSQGYFNAGQVLVVPAGSTGPRSPGDLSSSVAVEIGSAGEIEARRLAERRPDLNVQPYDSLLSALAAVRELRCPAALVDRVSAAEILKTDRTLRISGSPVTFEPYVVAARRADATLLSEIDAAIGAMRGDGTLAKLEQRWLGG